MEISEAKERRAELEVKIKEMLSQYEKDTGLVINCVSIERAREIGNDTIGYINLTVGLLEF